VANQMSSALRELREAVEPLLEHRPGGGHTRN
jgi:hypothetical protein